MKIIHLSEALRMLRRSFYVRKYGFKRYRGTPEQIAEQIIEDCWNKEHRYFMVSAGHFCEFYTRDFGMCAEALVKLGHRDRVIQTLEYALERFSRKGRITTTISPGGRCFDFPTYAVDSLPFLVHAMRVANAGGLLEKYRRFLGSEIDRFNRKVIEEGTYLVKRGVHFSSIKDYSKRNSSCYDNSVAVMLAMDLKALGMPDQFYNHSPHVNMMANHWNGHYFYEDMSKQKIITGDANTFPFWCGVIEKKANFMKCLFAMEKAGLTKPFPLKYSGARKKTSPVIWRELFAGDYERDTIWMHLGLCFLEVVKRFDGERFSIYMKQYEDQMTKHKNFLEVYDKDGNPFRTRFYVTDESMLWVAKYLALKKR